MEDLFFFTFRPAAAEFIPHLKCFGFFCLYYVKYIPLVIYFLFQSRSTFNVRGNTTGLSDGSQLKLISAINAMLQEMMENAISIYLFLFVVNNMLCGPSVFVKVSFRSEETDTQKCV